MKMGLVGLGKMGGQIAIKLVEGGHEVVVYDVDKELSSSFTDKGAEVADSNADVVKRLGENPIVWLMIPSKYVGDTINEYIGILPAGSILIDGGNSDFRLTIKRGEMAAEESIHLMDVGVSGGVHGLKNGFSMMAGGDKEAYQKVEPILKTLGAENGFNRFGKTGAGHFVKMIHNAVEYGMMQAFAEGYEMLKENKEFEDIDLQAVATVWQNGSVVDSWLNSLAEEFFKDDQDFADISGEVSESGEARWTLEYARDENFVTPVIQASFDRRLSSQQGHVSYGTKFLARLRNAFGGHSMTNIESSKD